MYDRYNEYRHNETYNNEGRGGKKKRNETEKTEKVERKKKGNTIAGHKHQHQLRLDAC